MREESLNVKGDCCCYCCCWRSKPTVKCLNRKSFHTLNLTLVLTRAREFSRLFYDCVSTEFSCGDLARLCWYTHTYCSFEIIFCILAFFLVLFFLVIFFPRVLLIIYFLMFLFSLVIETLICVWTGDDILSSLQTFMFPNVYPPESFGNMLWW